MGIGSRKGNLVIQGATRVGRAAVQAVYDEYCRFSGANTDQQRAGGELYARAATALLDYLNGTLLRGAVPPKIDQGWDGDFYLEIAYDPLDPYPAPPLAFNLYGPRTNRGWGPPIPIGTSGPPAPMGIATWTSSQTFSSAEFNKYVLIDTASAATATVPTNASVPFALGTVLQGAEYGAGQVTIAGASGVDIKVAERPKTRKQYGSFAIIKTKTNEWLLTGDLELA